MSGKKRILICPLDWGLGHATRCVPLIHALLKEGADVIIAADGSPLALLKEEFSNLKFIRLRGYHIHYSKRISMTLSMLLQSPKILFNIFLEHSQLKKIINDHKINCIISDNRYGLWNNDVYTVFITHQLSIKCPKYLRFLEPFLFCINHFFINKFDECWIPDAEGENNLSGELAHRFPLPTHGKFIGLLSRFDSLIEKELPKTYDLMAIISGPEPHRSLLQENLIVQLKSLRLSSLIVAGEPQQHYDKMINDNIRLVSHLTTNEMKEAIMQSEVIICRAGYSGIMDLVSLKKQAILIATPGQTEQEYLAQYMMQKGIFYSVRQKEFKIETALKELNRFGNISKISTEKKYLTAIKILIAKITE